MKKASDLIKAQPQITTNAAVLQRVTPDNAHVIVSITKQRAYLMTGDEIAIDSPISSGKRGHTTPTGSFTVLEKDKDHHSSLYGDYKDSQGRTVRGGISAHIDSAPSGTHFVGASMKWFMRLTGEGRRNARGNFARLSRVARLHSHAGTGRRAVLFARESRDAGASRSLKRRQASQHFQRGLRRQLLEGRPVVREVKRFLTIVEAIIVGQRNQNGADRLWRSCHPPRSRDACRGEGEMSRSLFRARLPPSRVRLPRSPLRVSK